MGEQKQHQLEEQEVKNAIEAKNAVENASKMMMIEVLQKEVSDLKLQTSQIDLLKKKDESNSNIIEELDQELESQMNLLTEANQKIAKLQVFENENKDLKK